MKVIKRNGSEVIFDITKIIIAITKANESAEEADRLTPVQIRRLAESVELQCQALDRAATVEEIQDMVENHIMAHGAFEVAKRYITYRYTRSLVRRSNTTDDKILSLMERSRETGAAAVTNAEQRDFIAGEVSRDLTFRVLLPGDISWAMHLEDALEDLRRIGRLPGIKVLLRGNHDYWWNSIGRVRRALPEDM